jgi:putative transcriptional regulator
VVSTGSLKGRLLVATPPLVDENFDRTVVLLLEHGPEGALGVVLNRPDERPVGEPLDRWAPFLSEPQVYFGGGPVETDAVIGLGRRRSSDPTELVVEVVDRVGTVDLSADPLEVVSSLEALRLFQGYAGWGARQLEGELRAGAWIVADFSWHDAFGPDPADLWREVLRRQGGRTAWLANYPDDVTVN